MPSWYQTGNPRHFHPRRPDHSCRRTSVNLRQDLLQSFKHPLPPCTGAPIGLPLVAPEARLLHAQVRARAGRSERPGDDPVYIEGRPRVGQRLVRLDDQNLTIDHEVEVGSRRSLKIEAVTDNRLEIVLHEPFLDQMRLCKRTPDLFRRMRELTLDNNGARPCRPFVHWSIRLRRSSS